MKEKKKAVAILAPRYQKEGKKQKGKMLDEFTALTGYCRTHASYVLSTHGKRKRVSKNTVIQADVRKTGRRGRKKTYTDDVKKALIKIWYIMDCICGKRLSPVMGPIVQKLEDFGEISLTENTRAKLIGMSASTIDRLVAGERRKQTIKGRSNTKPGTLLKNQIPVRTFSDWDEQRPGFVEIDLVGHDGGNAKGEFMQTLDVTDVCTTWTETEAVKNKAQVWVFEALKDIRKRLPFELLGIDSDSGGEFINHHLYEYCQQENITFTRSRSYRKNDNCFVEQKNYSVVRRAVGYLRYDTEEELRIINELYRHLRLYTNFFQPSMKLIEKTRIGSRVTKKHDIAQTPYHRVLNSPHISKSAKKALKRQYTTLNPASLKRKITRLQQKLLRMAENKSKRRRNAA
ncbi:MAG: DDE-type integrase/transposase/recombinase [Candidatus Aminicenantes bacterium]|nr:DDE-type integrase/transposase/recombinase [Candidatus Aminicenantes bacterium]